MAEHQDNLGANTPDENPQQDELEMMMGPRGNFSQAYLRASEYEAELNAITDYTERGEAVESKVQALNQEFGRLAQQLIIIKGVITRKRADLSNLDIGGQPEKFVEKIHFDNSAILRQNAFEVMDLATFLNQLNDKDDEEAGDDRDEFDEDEESELDDTKFAYVKAMGFRALEADSSTGKYIDIVHIATTEPEQVRPVLNEYGDPTDDYGVFLQQDLLYIPIDGSVDVDAISDIAILDINHLKRYIPDLLNTIDKSLDEGRTLDEKLHNLRKIDFSKIPMIADDDKHNSMSEHMRDQLVLYLDDKLQDIVGQPFDITSTVQRGTIIDTVIVLHDAEPKRITGFFQGISFWPLDQENLRLAVSIAVPTVEAGMRENLYALDLVGKATTNSKSKKKSKKVKNPFRDFVITPAERELIAKKSADTKDEAKITFLDTENKSEPNIATEPDLNKDTDSK